MKLLFLRKARPAWESCDRHHCSWGYAARLWMWSKAGSCSHVEILCRAPALSASGPGALCVGRGPGLSVSGSGALCRGPALSVSGPNALFCVEARRSVCRHPSSPRVPSSDPRATHLALRAPSSDPCATHPARHVLFFQERAPNLTVWGKKPVAGFEPFFRVMNVRNKICTSYLAGNTWMPGFLHYHLLCAHSDVFLKR